MRRFLTRTLLLIVTFSLLGVLFYSWLMHDRAAPRFEAGPVQVSPGTYGSISYEFLSSSPFEGGKMWISTWPSGAGGQTYHTYLYDIEKRAILGELINAQPAFFNHDQSEMLCAHWSRPITNALWLKIMLLVKQLSAGRIDLIGPNGEVETFWKLDLRKNSASRLGRAYTSP